MKLKLNTGKNFIITALLIILLVMEYSCEKFEGGQTIPSYISVDSFHLVANPLLELGVPTQNISDVWVYVDDQMIGAFELPAERIPVLSEGLHKLTLIAGIKYNGMSGTRGPYPFYEPAIDTTFMLILDSIVKVNPTITYYNTTYAAWYEDYEDGTISLEPSEESDTIMELYTFDTVHPVYGDACGTAFLDSVQNLLEVATYQEGVSGIELPKTSAPVFLEMEYNVNYSLVVGLFVIINEDDPPIRHPIVVLNPTDGEWKKIYINLTPAVSYYFNADYFNVFFRVDRTSIIDTAIIKLDNLKLIANEDPK